MKHRRSPRFKVLMLCLLFLCGGVATASDRDLNFKAIDLEGAAFHAQSLLGKVVLLDFWATWCGPCLKAFPVLNTLRKDFRDRGFEVLGVTTYSGTVEDVRKVLLKYQHDYPVVIGDEDLAERFEVIGYPTYFLVNRKGEVVNRYVGEIESLIEEVRSDIDALTREAPKRKGR